MEQERLEQIADLIADIIAEREKQGISQSALAELSGIKQSAISRMESMKSFPQLDTLVKILEPLGLHLVVIEENQWKERRKEMNYNAAGVSRFLVDVRTAKVTLESHEGKEFLVETEKEKEFTFSEKNGELVFAQKKKSLFKEIFMVKLIPVKILIPASFRGAVECRSDNGKIIASGLVLDSLTLLTDNGAALADRIETGCLTARASNGRVAVSGCKASSLEVTSDNGRLLITDCEIATGVGAVSSNGRVILKGTKAQRITLSTSNGSVTASDCCANHYALTSSNGKIVVAAGGQSEDFGYDLKTSNGSITVNGQKYRGGYVEKGKPNLIKATTSNGSITIAFSEFISEEMRRELEQEEHQYDVEASAGETDL